MALFGIKNNLFSLLDTWNNDWFTVVIAVCPNTDIDFVWGLVGLWMGVVGGGWGMG